MKLVWFRNDLRIADNPALAHGVKAGQVIGCYLLTPAQWRRHEVAAARVDFILRTLKVLSADLAAINIPLLIMPVAIIGGEVEAITGLLRRFRCDGLYWNNEYPLDEIRRDAAVEDAAMAVGCSVERFDDRVIAPPGSVVKADGTDYRVFTPFKRTWLKALPDHLRKTLPVPKPQSKPAGIKSSAVPDTVPGFANALPPELWPAGEGEAEARLERFVGDGLRAYEKQRDFPARSGTSCLSPYLAVGAVSPLQCLLGALSANTGGALHDNPNVEAWVDELIWREFYQHLLVAHPKLSMGRPLIEATERVPWCRDKRLFQAWCEGRTGIPLVDAGMRQLRQTGWMHNRVRMVTGMFLTKNLLTDWRWGERYFMNNLIDGDYAANNGGWQWSASTGTDAAPYFRIFNPFSQAARFDPEAEYIKSFVPELTNLAASTINTPEKLERARPQDYPAPIVDLKQSRQRAIDVFRKALKG